MEPPDRWLRIGAPLVYMYAVVLIALFISLLAYLPPLSWWEGEGGVHLLRAIGVTVMTSVVSTLIALLVGLPVAWRLVRRPVAGQPVIDVIIDLPLSLSPLVLGLAFLLFFTSPPGRWIEGVFTTLGLPLRGAPTGVIVSQTVIATAFAIRHLRAALAPETTRVCDQGLRAWISQRRSPVLVAATITWARTVGEFGPLLLFVGIVPGQSEVLSTAIYLSWTAGDLHAAALAACVMVLLSFTVTFLVRHAGKKRQ